MIALNYDLGADTVKLAVTVAIKAGADVAVRIVFSSAPGVVSALQLALGSNVNAPAVLAFTEDFEQENDRTWTALLDASDTRLTAFLAGKGNTVVNIELVAVIDGVRRVTPNVGVTVQPAVIVGPEASEGGPVYYTQAQVDAAIAAAAPRYFTAAIGNGDDEVTVTFDPAFGSVPVIAGLLVLKAAAEDADLSVAAVYGLTTGGFTAVLSAPAPAGTYVLHGSAKVL